MTTDGHSPSLSEAVVAAVADSEGVAPADLDRSLYEVIDPDALDALFNDVRGRVTFEYLGYVVTIDSEGDVELSPVERS
jgi:hypothetical protein